MYEVIFLWALALAWIIFAVIQDLKTREIANWLNFSLVIFALEFRFFYSLFNNDGFSFFYQGLIGLGVFFLLGNLFYYSRVFAGGDAKLMISFGAILPTSSFFILNIQSLLTFLLIFLFSGFAYIFATSTVLCIRHFKAFKKEFARQLEKKKKLMISLTLLGAVLILLGFFEIIFSIIGLSIIFISYLYMYSRAIDEVCMVRKIQAIHLREGDWLYTNLKVGNKIIKSNWNGLTNEEIKSIRKKYKQVKIRQGIPFSPNFLVSFIIFASFKIFNLNLWNPLW
ncbi:Preflagellin peptidase [uncultured archaeon]|nr:Preflagellin peptidase [uncultured archaeon]